MKFKLAGFEGCVELGDGAAVLEAHDERLFSRICASLYSERGGEALEPFLLWDDEGDEKSARNAFLFVANPFDLPWDDRGGICASWWRMRTMPMTRRVGA